MVDGDLFDPGIGVGPFPRVEVLKIDENSRAATVRLSYVPRILPRTHVIVDENADGRLELFALGGDGAVYYKWQETPNGGWGEWSGLAGQDLKQITIGRNADGRLELFVLGGDGGIWHKWQTTPNGGWTPEWISLDG